ncbi:MAG: cytidine deaminase [bacterium]
MTEKNSSDTHKLTALLEAAQKVQAKASAPYSHFPVGAALETKDGKIYTGCNIESSSFGLTICAERVALFKAISEGENEFTRIVVKTDTNEFCPPCGACRQVLFDFAPQIEIVMQNHKGEIRKKSIVELLPEAFGKEFLKNRDK